MTGQFWCSAGSAIRPMPGLGHQDAFPRTRSNGWCRFGQETSAGVRGNGRAAPIAAVIDVPSRKVLARGGPAALKQANGSNFFSAFQALWLGARARWQARSVTIGGPAPFGRFLPSIHHAGCAQCRWQTRIFTRSRAGSSYSARSCTRHLFSKARRDPGDLFFTRSLSSRRALRAAASIIRQDLEAAGH